MRLSYYCASPSCVQINYISVASNNRYDLKEEIGEEFNLRCKHCGKHTKKHINRLQGEVNMTIIGISVLVALALTIFTWNFGIIVGKITVGIPFFVWMDQKRRASAFNKIML